MSWKFRRRESKGIVEKVELQNVLENSGMLKANSTGQILRWLQHFGAFQGIQWEGNKVLQKTAENSISRGENHLIWGYFAACQGA